MKMGNITNIRTTAIVAVLACLMLVSGAVATYAEGYQSGPSGFSFASNTANNYGSYNNNGYTGSYGGIQTPHRGDWMNKLAQQRQYEEYVRKQNAAGNTAACGFTGAPSYCYTLVTKPRYPSEVRIVRY